MYRHYGTEPAVVPAAMFPVSPVRRGAAAVRPSVRPVRGRCRCPGAFGEVRTGAASPLFSLRPSGTAAAPSGKLATTHRAASGRSFKVRASIR